VRLRIEATPDELADKSEALIKALADTLSVVDPDLAERLEKAIPKDVPKLRQPALREIHERTRKLYEERLEWMLKDIGKVLDRSLAMVEEKTEKAEPGEEPEEKLEPGDINPDTGEEVPEEEELEDEEEEEEEAE